ncbi:MAG: alpha/beta fold hydrolase [Candidatus Binatia bacterium]
MTTDWTERTLTAQGVELFALERGGEAGRAPIVLLHGAGGNALTWTTIAPALADRRVLLLDMPGHGRSPKLPGWDLLETADAIARAIQAYLGNTRPIWGGHSWGGKVAGIIAAQHPSHCSGLVLVDPSPSAAVPVDIEEFVNGIWAAEMQSHASPEAAAETGQAQRHWQPWDDETALAFRHGIAERTDGGWSLRPTREDLVALATATLHVDAGELLANAAFVPTLLLVAEESHPWQGITNMIVYSGATQAVIPGHHWIHQCNRSAVMAAVSGWLPGR